MAPGARLGHRGGQLVRLRDHPGLGGLGRVPDRAGARRRGRQATRAGAVPGRRRRTPGAADLPVRRRPRRHRPRRDGRQGGRGDRHRPRLGHRPHALARPGTAVGGERAGPQHAPAAGQGAARAPEEWLAGQSEDRKPPPTALQSAYIAESGRAERRRMRRLATAACIAVAVAVTLAVLALLQRSEAIAQRDEARSRELAAKAGQQLDVDPELGILLALEALRTDRTAEGVDALRRAVSESHVRDVLGLARQRRHHHRASVLTARSSSPGGEDGSARISRSDDGSEVAALDAHDVPVRITTFDPSGERVLTAADDGTMRLLGRGHGSAAHRAGGPHGSGAVRRVQPRRPPAPHLRRHHGAPVGHLHRAFAARLGRRRVRAGVGRLPARRRADHDGQQGRAAPGSGTSTRERAAPSAMPGAQLFSAELSADGTRAVTCCTGLGAHHHLGRATGEEVASLGPGTIVALDPQGHRAGQRSAPMARRRSSTSTRGPRSPTSSATRGPCSTPASAPTASS